MGFGAEDALYFVESGRRRLVGDDGAAAEHQGVGAHSKVAVACSEEARRGLATNAGGLGDGDRRHQRHRVWHGRRGSAGGASG